mgnify:CR=1 FL=1
MKPQSLLAGLLALIFGGSAAVGVNSYLKLKSSSEAKPETVPVVVTAMDLPRGGTVTTDLVTTREFPKGMVPEGALTKMEDALERAVAIHMVKGEPVLDSKLSPRGAGRGLAALVSDGMRAVTIQTPNVATGLAGFVLPGNKVDVLLSVVDSGSDREETGGGSTTTLLQNVEVLAVDQRVDAPADNKVDSKELRSVTLLVTPHQANLLDLGQNKGTLRLALRSLSDARDSGTHPVTLKDLRFHQEKPWDEKIKGVLESLAKIQAQRPAPVEVAAAPVEPPPAKPARVLIRTIRGGHEGKVPIEIPLPVSVDRLAGGPSK